MKSLNYHAWKLENESILAGFSKKEIILTYTGGKDCSVILDFFSTASKEFSFRFQTHGFLFPVHVFTPDETAKLGQYWSTRGIKIEWHELPATDDEFEVAKSKGINPCTVCFQRKREYLYHFLKTNFQTWNAIVVVVGFTLWDLVSYSLEHLLFHKLHVASSNTSFQNDEKFQEDRFMQTSQRFYPFLSMKEGYSIYKPLLKYNDQAIVKIIEEKNIPLSTTSCKYKSYRPKRLFSDCYRQMNLLFDYDKLLSFAKNSLNLYDISYYSQFNKEEFISKIL